MSEEQLKAFLEAVKAEAGLQEKLKLAADADAVVEIAKAAGFAVSFDELERVRVSEEELEGVAGGAGWVDPNDTAGGPGAAVLKCLNRVGTYEAVCR